MSAGSVASCGCWPPPWRRPGPSARRERRRRPRRSSSTQGRIDPRQDVNFSALVSPQVVFVGQQVTYQIGVFLSDEIRARLRRNPEFVPPDVRSMLSYDLSSPSRPLTRVEGGRYYDVHVFQRALFPLTAGRARGGDRPG